MIITNAAGRKFFVKIVGCGQAYGLGGACMHGDEDPLVEVYDHTYANPAPNPAEPWAFGPEGQFVTRYYAETLAGMRDGAGICLDGGVPEWQIDGPAWAPVVALARRVTRPEG
jgi:hypothetical protein